MKTIDAIARYETLESIRDNEGGTFCRTLTNEETSEFCNIGFALLESSSLSEYPDFPVQWRNRFYTENIRE